MNVRRMVCAAAVCAAICEVFSGGGADARETRTAEIYYIDRDLVMLVPIEVTLDEETLAGQAREVISKIIEGKDTNERIRRFIPNVKGSINVRIDRNRAYVDLSRSVVEAIPDTYDAQILTVYSIVNSLTSIDGIDMVRFRVDGSEKNPFRYIDLRETFITEYF